MIRVLLDVDGVLADFIHAFKHALRMIDPHHPQEHVRHDWDIVKAWDIPKPVADAVFGRLNEPGIATSLPVLEGAQEAVARLRKVAEVFVVTSPMRGATWHRERELWLMRHFDIPTKNIIHTSAKYVISGDFLIDDRPENVEKWELHHPFAHGLLWGTDFNRHAKHPRRCESWAEVFSHIG